MRAIVQRVSQASVTVEQNTVGSISHGVLVLLGIAPTDTKQEADWLVEKIAKLRIFEDTEGKMNHSLEDIKGEVLVVSQFTLYGDCKKGTRPSYTGAAHPDIAEPLYSYVCEAFQNKGISTATGIFGAHMHVSLVNDGPVTLIIEKESLQSIA